MCAVALAAPVPIPMLCAWPNVRDRRVPKHARNQAGDSDGRHDWVVVIVVLGFRCMFDATRFSIGAHFFRKHVTLGNEST